MSVIKQGIDRFENDQLNEQLGNLCWWDGL